MRGYPPIKHIIDSFQTGQNVFATPLVIPLAIGTVNPNSYSNPTQCRNGSIITKLTVQLDFMDSQFNSLDAYDWYIWFNIGGTQARPQANLVNSSTLKNQVFHQDGFIVFNPQATAVGSTALWKNSYRLDLNIPRGLQQLNENDTIEIVILGGPNAGSLMVKAKVIYKEIFP